MTKFQNVDILWSGRNIQSLSFSLISLDILNIFCQSLGVQKCERHSPNPQEQQFIKTVNIQFKYSVDIMS